MDFSKDLEIVYKRQAAEAAVEYIDSGMVVGLGHGSTANFAVEEIARRLASGVLENITGIPCSKDVAQAAEKLGISLSTLEEHPSVEITIDGADEVDPNFDLIKGGGGALLMEKRVALASRREIIVVDESKMSSRIGTQFALPVEVIETGWQTAAKFIEGLGAKVELRSSPEKIPFHTDSNNLILDCDFGPIENPGKLDLILVGFEGVVDHGLFLGLASDVIVAGPSGLKHLMRSDA